MNEKRPGIDRRDFMKRILYGSMGGAAALKTSYDYKKLK
jgi:hypothetical protein